MLCVCVCVCTRSAADWRTAPRCRGAQHPSSDGTSPCRVLWTARTPAERQAGRFGSRTPACSEVSRASPAKLRPYLVARQHLFNENSVLLTEALVNWGELRPVGKKPVGFVCIFTRRLRQHVRCHLSAVVVRCEDVCVWSRPVQVVAHVAEAVQVVSRQRVITQLSEILRSQVLASITRHGVLAWGQRREGWKKKKKKTRKFCLFYEILLLGSLNCENFQSWGHFLPNMQHVLR